MHNLLTNSTDLLRCQAGSSADLDCIVSFIEYTNSGVPVPDPFDTQFTNIPNTTLTTILGAPSTGSDRRRIKEVSIVNTHASVSTTVRVVIERTGGVLWDVYNTVTLQPGESLTYTEGTGWYPNKNATQVIPVLPPVGSTNLLTGANQSGFASDTYMNNSVMKLDAWGSPTIGRKFNWRFIISKTGAGTVAPIILVRTGTAGTTADTTRVTFTWGAGTANADRAEVEMEVVFLTVGGGSAATLRGKANATTNLTTTGWSNAVKALQPADSGGFDSTAAGLLIGLSYNGGTSAVHDVEFMNCWTEQL